MDPNTALDDLRQGIADYLAAHARTDAENVAAAVVIESAESLDEWLSKGGFLPAAWQR